MKLKRNKDTMNGIKDLPYLKTIKNEHFITWPCIDNLNFATLLGTTKVTEFGHLDQERSNFHSTQQQHEEEGDLPPLK